MSLHRSLDTLSIAFYVAQPLVQETGWAARSCGLTYDFLSEQSTLIHFGIRGHWSFSKIALPTLRIVICEKAALQ